MAIAIVNGGAAHTQAVGLNGVTTSAIDTTGATILVAHISRYTGGSAVTLSDSKGNTWTPLTEKSGVGSLAARLYYCASPTVGSGHTFTISGSVIAASVQVAAFSGVTTTSPFDVENGSTATGTSLNTGSVTPSVNGSLIIAGLGTENVGITASINSGLSITDQISWASGSNEGGALAWYEQPTAAAINPAWSWSGSAPAAATIASFKPVAGGGGGSFKPGWAYSATRMISGGLAA